MSYMSISNLYKNKDILLFKQCYALCKVHGTSAHVKYKSDEDKLVFFSGGAKHDQYVTLFNQDELLAKFRENAKEHSDVKCVTIYGEAYGGNMQGMSHTYGDKLQFIAFEAQADETWLSVPQAERLSVKLGFEFVPYKIIDTTEEAINAEMMADSEVAIRRGMGSGHMREGIVLRPLVELIHPNGGRIICKHKRPEFAERKSTPKFSDPNDLKILEDAKAIVEEWVTEMRLVHVLDAFPNASMEDTGKIIKAMYEDVAREAEGEILMNDKVKKLLSQKTALLLKEFLKRNTFEVNTTGMM